MTTACPILLQARAASGSTSTPIALYPACRSRVSWPPFPQPTSRTIARRRYRVMPGVAEDTPTSTSRWWLRTGA